MTSNDPDADREYRITQMADALIARLGPEAEGFADRQMRAAEGSVRETWATISAYLERRRDRH